MERLATVLAGACCDPSFIQEFHGEGQQLEVLSALIKGLGFDAVTPYLNLLKRRPEAPLAVAIAQGLGERLNSAATDLRNFLFSPEADSVVAPFLIALTDLEPSPQFTQILEDLSHQASPDKREAIAEMLSRAVHVADLAEAERLLRTPDETHRRAALRFYGKARDERAAESLVNFLSSATDLGWNAEAQKPIYACLGSMRSHHGFAYLEKVMTAKGLTGKLKASTEEQILALSGLVACQDAMAEKLLKQVAQSKAYPGPVKLALQRLRSPSS